MSEKCSATVRVNDSAFGRWRQCSRKGVVFESNEWRCKQHSRAAESTRQEKREARWLAEADEVLRKRRRKKIAFQWAEQGPKLLAALRDFYGLHTKMQWSTADCDYHIISNAASVIRAAEDIGGEK